jgi:predicted nuclease of predicted toxin-antitoxin system
MNFLADENFPRDAVEALRAEGHDVLWIRTEYPGITDPEVLSIAQAENRILLTFDKDFGELAFVTLLPASCGIVLFRLQAASANILAQKVIDTISLRTDWVGHFSVVENNKIRMRQL